MEVTKVLFSEPDGDDDDTLQLHAEASDGSQWPCVVMLLILCVMVLGLCFGTVYLLVNTA
jgi:hypothetical protein